MFGRRLSQLFCAGGVLFSAFTLNARAAVLINEVAPAVNGDATAQFVELYNSGSAPVNLTGWRLARHNRDNPSGDAASITLSGTIPAKGYFLVTGGAYDSHRSETVPPLAEGDVKEAADGTFFANATAGTAGLELDNAQIGLRDQSDAVVDAVGYGQSAAGAFTGDYVEGTSKLLPGFDTHMSIYRDPFTHADTNNNDTDFIYQTFTFDVAVGSQIIPIVTPTNSHATPAGTVIISEVAPAINGDLMAEFIELYNPTSQDVDLEGWGLARRAKTGSTDAGSLVLHGVIPAHKFFLVASPRYADYKSTTTANVQTVPTADQIDTNQTLLGPLSPGGTTSGGMGQDNARIGLKDATGAVIDAVAWAQTAQGYYPSNYFETKLKSLAGFSSRASLARVGNADTNNNDADFATGNITPTNSSAVDPGTILINELAPGVAGDPTAQFIELYNPGEAARDLTGWKLARSNRGGAAGGQLILSGAIPAHGYFLVTSTGYETEAASYMFATLMPGDQVDNAGVFLGPNSSFAGMEADNAQVGLFDNNGAKVDGVGYGQDSSPAYVGAYVEGTSVLLSGFSSKRSISRRANHMDTDNNNADFVYPPYDDIMTPTNSHAIREGKVLISEVAAGVNVPEAEFIELYNPGDNSINLTGWSLARRSMGGGPDAATLTLSGTIPAHQYFLITGGTYDDQAGLPASDLKDTAGLFFGPNSPGAGLDADNGQIALKAPNGSIIDGVGYNQDTLTPTPHFVGIYVEGNSKALPGFVAQRSIGRDETTHADSGDNEADFTYLDVQSPHNSSYVNVPPTAAPNAAKGWAVYY